MKQSYSAANEQNEAQTLALNAVQFILSDDEYTHGFIAATGIAANDLKSLISDADFLLGVLDYLMAREDVLLAFCENIDADPEHVVRLHQKIVNAGMRVD